LEQILQIFKDNVLLGVSGAGIVFWLEWLFKGSQKTPERWRRSCEFATIVSMVVGIYWVPAQAADYWAIGAGVVLVAAWLNLQPVSYATGAGFQQTLNTLPFRTRVGGMLGAVWAPMLLPGLQWFLHRSLPATFTEPRVANPLLSIFVGASLRACTAAALALGSITFCADLWRERKT